MHLFFLVLLMPVVLIGLCAAGFWIWMLVDGLTNPKLSGCQRACPALFILSTHLVGTIVSSCTRRSPQLAPSVAAYQTPPQPHREPMQPEAYHPYQEGYPCQQFSRDAQAWPEPAPLEQAPLQSQARYEEIQLSYPEEFY